jgi:hypothetical protein
MRWTVAAAVVLLLAGCGGGGSSSTTTTTAELTTTTSPSDAAINQLQAMKDAESKIENALKATPTDSAAASAGCVALKSQLALKAELLGYSLPASAGVFVGKAVDSAQAVVDACNAGTLRGTDLLHAIFAESQADLAMTVIRNPSAGVPVS